MTLHYTRDLCHLCSFIAFSSQGCQCSAQQKVVYLLLALYREVTPLHGKAKPEVDVHMVIYEPETFIAGL